MERRTFMAMLTGGIVVAPLAWRSGKIGAMALPSSALWDGPAPD